MRAGVCIHYNGCGRSQTCNVGVNYHESFGKGPGIIYRLPCLTMNPRKEEFGPVGYCQFKLEPTPEQIKTFEEEREIYHQHVMAAIMMISDWRKGHTAGVSRTKTFECPACKKDLVVTQSGYNGHVHGLCETEGCLAWME